METGHWRAAAVVVWNLDLTVAGEKDGCCLLVVVRVVTVPVTLSHWPLKTQPYSASKTPKLINNKLKLLSVSLCKSTVKRWAVFFFLFSFFFFFHFFFYFFFVFFCFYFFLFFFVLFLFFFFFYAFMVFFLLFSLCFFLLMNFFCLI